jgi:hypothetical protein
MSVLKSQQRIVGALVYPCRLSGYVSRLAMGVISVVRQMSLKTDQGHLWGEEFNTFLKRSPPIPTRYKIIGAPKKFKTWPPPLFTPKTNHTCYQR